MTTRRATLACFPALRPSPASVSAPPPAGRELWRGLAEGSPHHVYVPSVCWRHARRVPEGAASGACTWRHAAGPVSPRTAERSNPGVLTMPLCAAEPAARRLDFGVFQGRRPSLLRGEGGRDDSGIKAGEWPEDGRRCHDSAGSGSRGPVPSDVQCALHISHSHAPQFTAGKIRRC